MSTKSRVLQMLQSGSLTTVEIALRLHLDPEACDSKLARYVGQGILARQAVDSVSDMRPTFCYSIRNPEMLPPAVRILRFLQETGSATREQLLQLLHPATAKETNRALDYYLNTLFGLGLIGIENGPVKGASLYSWRPLWHTDTDFIFSQSRHRTSTTSPELLWYLRQGQMSLAQLQQRVVTVPKGRVHSNIDALVRLGLVVPVWIKAPAVAPKPIKGISSVPVLAIRLEREPATKREPDPDYYVLAQILIQPGKQLQPGKHSPAIQLVHRQL